MIDDIQISNTLKIKFTHDSEADLLSPGKKLTLFRIIQEQLKNILTHSQANETEIHLQCRNSTVMLIIKDNGTGFNSKLTRRGIGLSTIFERTRFYNGTTTIETAPGKGCLLKILMPAA
ncbi:MAG: ATP-binding protein [Bacteroidota bacterium]